MLDKSLKWVADLLYMSDFTKKWVEIPDFLNYSKQVIPNFYSILIFYVPI